MNPIRPADMDDLERVAEIVREVTQDMDRRGIPQWDHIYPDRSILQSDIASQAMYVIDDGGVIVGLVTLNEEQPPEYGEISWAYAGRAMVVHRLVVAPEHQGRKLASQLMRFAERKAASRGYDAIRLDAFTRNPAAIALYEHRGYRKAGMVRFRKGLFFCYEKLVSP